MFEKERAKLESEIDGLSPILEFVEKQMQERVIKLRDYQEAHYRHKLGFDKGKEKL